MPLRTKLFQQLPWVGGVNTSLNEAMIPQNQLVQADNLVFDTRGSRKLREGIDSNFDDASNTTESLLGIHSFFRDVSGIKTATLMSVSSDKNVYSYTSSGTRTTLALDAGATAWADDVTKVSFTTINNLAIIAVDGATNVIRKWAGGSADLFDLGGSPPRASIVTQHLGRVWTNDKDNRERLHYCTTSDPEEWNGSGDSGAIDIGIGDGDPEGITAMFAFKGQLFVGKRTKLYRISGFTPESFQVEKISDGIGIISHNSIAFVDQDDVYFASERGFHSITASSNFGDFNATYLSADIQKTFNDDFQITRRDQIQGVYLATLNSVLFAVTDSTISSGENNTIWLYNFPLKSWYRWPNVSCESIAVVDDTDQKRFYVGSNTERLAKGLNGISNDVNTAGTEVAIDMTIKTGLIFPEQDPYTIKGFKKFALVYAPTASHSITATIKIDNYPDQALTFDTTTGLALLGTTFILGTSKLGTVVVVAPFAKSLDGFGRGFQLLLEQSGTDQTVEIQGFSVEYEPASTQQEVVIPV